jgi:hypothetical protein
MAHRIPLWVDLLVLLDGESDPGHDQERPKQIDNPVKCLDQRDSHRAATAEGVSTAAGV